MGDVNERIAAKINNEDLIAERRARLVPAATELFLQRGFHDTTVRDIAAAAGWQVGKLYLYISRKEDVLYLISDNIMSELYEGLLRLPPAANATEELHAAARYVFATTDRLGRQIQLLYRESASLLPEHLQAIKEYELKIRDVLDGIIRRGIENGEFRPARSLLLAHDIIMLAAVWALKHWTLSRHVDFETYVERQMELILSRLRPSSGAGATADAGDDRPIPATSWTSSRITTSVVVSLGASHADSEEPSRQPPEHAVQPLAGAVAPLQSLVRALRAVPDRRKARGQRFNQTALLALAVCAMIDGAHSLHAIAHWGSEHAGTDMFTALGISRDAGPSVTTLFRLFRDLDVGAFERALAGWLVEQGVPAGELLAEAGSPVVGREGDELPGVQLVAAYARLRGPLSPASANPVAKAG